MEQTSRFIRPLLIFLFPSAPDETITLYHGYIRKLAHFAEYAVLAVLAARALIPSSVSMVRDRWFLWTIALACVVALLDEVNQSFNTARTGSPYDILLDLFGAFCAAAIIYLFLRQRTMSRSET